MPKEIRLGLLDAHSVTKPPVLHFVDGLWRCWTAYNPELTLGTYIALYSDGTMERITICPDGTIKQVRL